MDESTDIPSAIGSDDATLDETLGDLDGEVVLSAHTEPEDRWATALQQTAPRKRSQRLLPVALIGVLLIAFSGMMLVEGSGATPRGSTVLAPTATAYDTATATATDTATSTATATKTAKPTATLPPVKYQPPKVVKGGGGTPPPPPPTQSVPAGPSPAGGIPNISGQVVLVNIDQQWLWVYQDRKLIYDTPVTTGMPQLPTPTGMFTIQWRETNVTFISPWPPGSPYYYAPEHINYAMYFADDGYYIHDAPWRYCFGPGTNVPHTCSNANGVSETGSHGCVNVPTPAGAWLYVHTHNGATVDIINQAVTESHADTNPESHTLANAVTQPDTD